MVWGDGGMARWSGEIGSWKVAPLLSLTNSHTIGGTEGISPIIISYTMQYTLQITIWESTIQFIGRLLVVDDKLNHIGWVEPKIINP